MANKYYELGFNVISFTNHDFFATPTTLNSDIGAVALLNFEIGNGRGPDGEGMLIVPNANELSLSFADIAQSPGSHHLNVYRTNVARSGSGQPISEYLANLQTAKNAGGANEFALARINHPGRYTGAQYPAEPFALARAISDNPLNFLPHATLYRNNPVLVGMEIINKFDTESQADRILWDNILTQLMPDIMAGTLNRKPVWGFSEDDSHSMAAAGFSYNLMLMPELTMDAIYDSKVNGTFFAFSRVDREYGIYPRWSPDGPDRIQPWDWNASAIHAPVLAMATPVINSITVDGNAITIDADNYETIRWYADGVMIHMGETLNLRQHQLNVYSYVRASVAHSNLGVLYTQPFGVKIGTPCGNTCTCDDCAIVYCLDCYNPEDECICANICEDCGEEKTEAEIILSSLIKEYNDEEIQIHWAAWDEWAGWWDVNVKSAIIADGPGNTLLGNLAAINAEEIEITMQINAIDTAGINPEDIVFQVYREYGRAPWGWDSGGSVSFTGLGQEATAKMDATLVFEEINGVGIQIEVDEDNVTLAEDDEFKISFEITDAKVIGGGGCGCEHGGGDKNCTDCGKNPCECDPGNGSGNGGGGGTGGGGLPSTGGDGGTGGFPDVTLPGTDGETGTDTTTPGTDGGTSTANRPGTESPFGEIGDLADVDFIDDDFIAALLESDLEPIIDLRELGETGISAAALQLIAESGRDVTVILPNGMTYTIIASSILPGAPAFDLNIEVIMTGNATAFNGIRVPANSIVINPNFSGLFGFSIEFSFTAEELRAAGINGNNVKLWYVDHDGNVTDTGKVKLNADGSISFTIDRASFYVLSETAPIPTADRNPATAVVISFTGLVVSTAAILASKRRRK